MLEDLDKDKARIIAVKLPRKYYRAVRKLAAEHEIANAQVICLALDALQRDADAGEDDE
jgi:hypothetical protein